MTDLRHALIALLEHIQVREEGRACSVLLAPTLLTVLHLAQSVLLVHSPLLMALQLVQYALLDLLQNLEQLPVIRAHLARFH